MNLNDGLRELFREIPAQALVANDRSEKQFSDGLFLPIQSVYPLHKRCSKRKRSFLLRGLPPCQTSRQPAGTAASALACISR